MAVIEQVIVLGWLNGTLVLERIRKSFGWQQYAYLFEVWMAEALTPGAHPPDTASVFMIFTCRFVDYCTHCDILILYVGLNKLI